MRNSSGRRSNHTTERDDMRRGHTSNHVRRKRNVIGMSHDPIQRSSRFGKQKNIKSSMSWTDNSPEPLNYYNLNRSNDRFHYMRSPSKDGNTLDFMDVSSQRSQDFNYKSQQPYMFSQCMPNYNEQNSYVPQLNHEALTNFNMMNSQLQMSQDTSQFSYPSFINSQSYQPSPKWLNLASQIPMQSQSLPLDNNGQILANNSVNVTKVNSFAPEKNDYSQNITQPWTQFIAKSSMKTPYENEGRLNFDKFAIVAKVGKHKFTDIYIYCYLLML